ncbi:radial spoke head protein 9 [Strigomonas culicis]|uniref:Radial spoke head protein 9 n=1 Tax=Strigomonas culicis TaxID=28005 RepID=S9VTS5_9TRYP|nr:radial spoke head protein 9 [Strigomonas culicis]|eukprot:EPY26605.1 radial spoke head protein 9 [Strigomonas culicis]
MAAANAQYLSLVGRALHVSEVTAVECSLPLLAQRYGAPAELWGKVLGYKRDYVVAQLRPGDFFGPRVTFASVDGGNNWTLLSDVSADQAVLCEELRGPFVGDLNYLYKVRRDIPDAPAEPTVDLPAADDALAQAKAGLAEAQSDADDEEEEREEGEEGEEGEEDEGDAAVAKRKKNKPKFMLVSVTEGVRLAHFVRLHDDACRLVVRAEYALQGQAVGERNRFFAGQVLNNALKPSCYLKAAHLGDPARNATLYGHTYNEHTDYLRPITDDAPVGVWSVKYDATLNVVAVQNLLFEGSLFWYRPGTVEHGQIYVGTAERNFDLFFAL